MFQCATLCSCQWCLRVRAICSEGPPACENHRLSIMASGAETVKTQEGDDIVGENFPKQGITWMTRPKAAILQEIRERLRNVKKEMFRTEDVANKNENI